MSVSESLREIAKRKEAEAKAWAEVAKLADEQKKIMHDLLLVSERLEKAHALIESGYPLVELKQQGLFEAKYTFLF